jgi:energy-coupling factor transporter ATP-binding protein EcfA2
MLAQLTLRNFRGFEYHEIPFRDRTIIVGKNNAGKSTIVEALRLVSIVVSRYRNLSFHPGPEWTGAGRAAYGVRPSLKNMEITFEGMFHRYADPPASITAHFQTGQTVCVYVADDERMHAVLRTADGKLIKTRQAAIEANLPSVSIMPQVAPVQKKEAILSEDYVRSAMSSALAPLHFRNQLAVRYDLFPEFCRIVAETWPGVMVDGLIGRDRHPGEQLYLEIRNEDFVGEVGLMGHGLQMWLQAMWFLTLSRDSQTVILDEPDVYMHPDLQRRIVRFLRHRHAQFIITTHSVEILSEVHAEQVLVVDRRKRRSSFAPAIPAVQRLIDNIGSVHNIHITRLWQARRFLMVEGKDVTLLKVLQDILYPQSSQPIDAIPGMSIGGWGGWPYAVGSAMLLKNSMDETITAYCLLDSDYHTPEEIAERQRQAVERNVQLHIWSAKEIENYFLVPSLIQRTIAHSMPARGTAPTEDEVADVLLKLAGNFRDEVLDGLASEILARERKLALGTANKRARERLDQAIQNVGSLLHLCPGKAAISSLSDWSQRQFGVQIAPLKLARSVRREEISPELVSVLSSIENAEPFAE